MEELVKPKDFRAIALRVMPASARTDAQRVMDEYDALSPDEQAEIVRQARERDARKLSEQYAQLRWDRTGLIGKQLRNTFAAYHPKTAEQIQALKAARKFTAGWPGVDKGLMFYGPAGRGKDHLLHAVVIGLRQRGVKSDVRYWYGLDIEAAMIREWDRDPGAKSSDDSKTEELMRECDLLLIGDLHRILHVKSPQIVHAITRTLNQCETTGKPILCCTGNFGLADYDKQFGDSVGSRLAACCDWWHVDGEDARRR